MTIEQETLSNEDWKQLITRGLPILLLAGFGLVARTTSECHNVLNYIGVHTSWMPSLSFASLVWLWWVCVLSLLWWLQSRGVALLQLSLRSVLINICVAVLLAVTHMALLQFFVEKTVPLWPEWGHTYLTRGCITGERFSQDLFTYGVLLVISFAVFQQMLSRRSLLRRIALEQELTAAQLQALQSQLEPHFLFNALNAIQSLVDLRRPEQASEALVHLNAILRSSLRRTTPEKVALSEELHVVQSYLAIQQIRFADRIQVRFDTGPEVMHSLVPNFILQPLVENAIHHGLAPKLGGGIIETSAHRRGEMLCLRVADDGVGHATQESKGHGIGLQNIRKRLGAPVSARISVLRDGKSEWRF